jgi:hypothetical protein
MNPITLNLGDTRFIKVYIGGKKGNEIFYSPPVDEIGNAILPHQCRLDNKTYALDIRMNVDVEYVFEKDTETKRFENIMMAQHVKKFFMLFDSNEFRPTIWLR